MEKFDKSSEEINREEEGSKNLKEDKKIKKKKKEEEVLEMKTKKISEYFAFKPNKKVAYLEEGSVKENCELFRHSQGSKSIFSTITASSKGIFTINIRAAASFWNKEFFIS